MLDIEKDRAQLLGELAELRQRVTELESHNADLSEDRYRLLAENVTDMISRHSITGAYLDVTASCHGLIGYTPEELIGRNAYTFIHPDDNKAVRHSHNTITEQKRTYTIEYRLRHKQGHYIWVESISHVVRTGTDKPYILVVTRDITERKAAEEKLTMFQYSVDRATDAIFWITGDAGFSYVNEQACRSLGYTCEELLNLKLWDIDPMYSKEHWDAICQVGRENPQMGFDHLESLHHRKDGSVFPVEIALTHLRFDDRELHMAVCHDITERKQMEQVLHLTQFSVDQASIGIVRAGSDAQILNVNPYFCQLMGYSAEELCTMHIYDIIPGFSWEQWQDHRVYIRQHKVFTSEIVHQRKDGTTFPAEVTITFVSYQDEEFSYSFVQDITERKQAEEALRLNSFTVERVSDAVYWIDRNAIITDANEAACRLFGYSREEMIGLSVVAIDPTKSPDEINALWEHIKQEGSIRIETQHQTKTGHVFPVEVVVSYISHEGKELNCAFARDITERKQAEAKLKKNIAKRKQAEEILRENQAVLRSILESIQDGLLVVTGEGAISHYNSRFCMMWTLPEDLIRIESDQGLIDYVLPQLVEPEQFTAKIETLYQTAETSEDVLHLKDGRLFERMSYPLIQDDQHEGRVWLFRDITKRKQAEEALRLSNFALERTADAVYWMRHGQILDVNEAACRMLGYSREELQNMPLTALDPNVVEIDVDEAWENVKEGDISILETQHRAKDGRLIPVEIITNYITFEGKEFNCCFARDITERKQVQMALQESEERLRQAVQVGGIGIFDHDHIQGTIYLSPKYQELIGQELGVSTSLEEFFNLVHPDDREGVLQTLRRGHDPAGDGNNYIEHRIIDSNGTLRWINTRSHTFFEGEGQDRHPVRTIGATIDITERKRAEAALRHSEERLRQAVHAGNVGIFDHDHILDILYVSPQYREIIGWDPDEPTTFEKLVAMIHPEDQEQILQAIQDAHDPAGDGHFQVENRTINRSGAIRWLNIRSQTLFDEEGNNRHPVRTIGAVMDITERKRTEVALQVSEERLQQAIHVGNIGIFDHDHIQNTVYMSQRYHEILDWEPEDPVSMEKFAAVIHPDDIELVNQTVQKAYDPASDGNFHVEHRVIDREGVEHWLSVRAYTYFEGEGRDRHPVRTIGAMADITEHKQVEQQRLDLALEKERSDTLRMLIGNISHDIKTPLAIINTSLYLLERLTDSQKRREKMDNIKSQVHALEHFIQDLLALSRLDGNPKLRLTPVDVNELVLDIEAETQPMIEQKQIIFTVDLAEDISPIQADQADLRRALTNLVENALNYTPVGQTVTVRTRKQADNTLVEVMDTGIGIDESELPHIFDRFYRAPQAQTIVSSGSGLGLAIVQRVIKMHGGSIDVMSQPGTGTTFRIQLPPH